MHDADTLSIAFKREGMGYKAKKGIDIFKKSFVFFIYLIILGFVPAAQVPPPPPAPVLSETADYEEGRDNAVVKKGIISFLKDIQLKGTTFIKKKLDILKVSFDIKTFFVITFFSLVYGIFHTLGPGHGKLIVVSFFLRDNTTKADAFALSVIISFVHSASAVILAILFQTILTSVKGLAHIRIQNGFTLFSGVLILSLGVFYLIRYIRKEGHKTSKDTSDLEALPFVRGRWKRNLIVGLSIGIVPCPLSLTIMMLSIIYGIFWVGITSVISLTIAMVLVLYFISLYTIKSRLLVEHRRRGKSVSGISAGIKRILNYIGNTALIFLGFYLMYRGGVAFVNS